MTPILDRSGVLVACPQCATRNRMTFARLGHTHRCGACKTHLPAPAVPLEVPDEAAFEALVRDAAVPVLVDYWAPWCGPCHMVAPELEKVAQARAGRTLVAKVDTEALPALGERGNVRSIPTMAVFAHGREVSRTSGARPASAIEAFVDEALVNA